MTLTRTLATAALSLLLALAGRPATAQAPAGGAAPSVQQQLDELREGQRRILAELEALKARLAGTAPAGSPVTGPKAGPVLSVNVFGEPYRGAEGAKVAILEYSDFDCPFCAHYANGIFPRIDAAYLRTGKVKYFFRDLPLPEHAKAAYKAQAARCAGDQGRFWEAHEWLFKDQRPLEGERLDQFIHDLGLDAATFKASLASGKYAEAIRQSARSAEHLDVRGTPAFLIGTLSPDGHVLRVAKLILGAPSFEGFQEVLEPLLGEATPAAAPAAAAPQAKAEGGSTCG